MLPAGAAPSTFVSWTGAAGTCTCGVAAAGTALLRPDQPMMTA
jgi:hypothetical protein